MHAELVSEKWAYVAHRNYSSTGFIKKKGRRRGGEKGELIALNPSPT
jgi:hypothetical protein